MSFHIKVDGKSWCVYPNHAPVMDAAFANDFRPRPSCQHESREVAEKIAEFIGKYLPDTVKVEVIDGPCDQRDDTWD